MLVYSPEEIRLLKTFAASQSLYWDKYGKYQEDAVLVESDVDDCIDVANPWLDSYGQELTDDEAIEWWGANCLKRWCLEASSILW